jgi:hypothetical protein
MPGQIGVQLSTRHMPDLVRVASRENMTFNQCKVHEGLGGFALKQRRNNNDHELTTCTLNTTKWHTRDRSCVEQKASNTMSCSLPTTALQQLTTENVLTKDYMIS